jgi:hypothetical protein
MADAERGRMELLLEDTQDKVGLVAEGHFLGAIE